MGVIKNFLTLKILIISILFFLVDVAHSAIYVFVSHSMNNNSLQQYYQEAEALGATLVMRGLIDDSFTKNQERAALLGIGYDIDPELFDQFAVTVVPAIVRDNDGVVQKITGHLPLREALKIFDEEA